MTIDEVEVSELCQKTKRVACPLHYEEISGIPECPYCGEEMELHNIPDGLWWYQCGCCGATAPSDETPAQALAAALHRAEPENRVLTVEELAGMAKKGEWELAWMECRNIKSEKCFLMQKLPGIAGKHGVWFVTPGQADDIFYAAHGYNKTWRCWLREPTAEEMEREKWRE